MDQQYKLALKIIFTVFLLAGLIWFIREILWVINLLFISVLLVYAISPAVNFLENRKFPHWLSVGLVYLALLALVALLFYMIIPIAINEIVQLTQLLPNYIQLIEPAVTDFIQMIQNPQFEEILGTLIQQAPANLQQLLNQATAFTFAFFSRLTEILIILFLVFYLLKDFRRIRQGIIRAIPQAYRQEITRILIVLDEKVGEYLRGNILRCTFVGLLTGLGLYFIGMPFYFVLGIFAGIMNIIYYIGPYIAAVPAVLITLSPDAPGTILIMVFYVFIQALDAFVLTPLLMGRAVNVKPFTIIVSILIGARLMGVLGIILAIPFAATLKVVINLYAQENNNSIRNSSS